MRIFLFLQTEAIIDLSLGARPAKAKRCMFDQKVLKKKFTLMTSFDAHERVILRPSPGNVLNKGFRCVIPKPSPSHDGKVALFS